MSKPKLIAKGQKPDTADWNISFKEEHEYRYGEGPPREVQRQASDLLTKHLMTLLQHLQLLGYDPATMRFSITFEPTPLP